VRAIVVGFVLTLAACGQTSAPPSGETPAESAVSAAQYQLTCVDFANVTLASLQQRFGAENVSEQTLDGPEGMQYTATVVFANDAARRLEVIWAEGAAHAKPSAIVINGEGNLWVGPSGVEVGMPLAELEAANGAPFDISGFGWDYGGSVTDWRDGNVSRAGCNVQARLDPHGEAPGVQGDSIFRSDLPAMRAANASVYEFGLGFPQDHTP
jgi:hypothetical protein